MLRIHAVVLIVSMLLLSGNAIAGDDSGAFLLGQGATGVASEEPSQSAGHNIGRNGAVGLSYPIDVPPGLAKLTPSVSLEYSSQSGVEGWVGFGWNLSMSSISRSLVDGVPEYDATDEFVLEGNKLIQSAATPGLYFTEIHNFKQVRRVRWDVGSGEWVLDPAGEAWAVQSKSGTLSIYGSDDDSKIAHSSGEIFSWLLTYVIDVHGNSLHVSYDRVDAGRAYIKEIRYGLRKTATELRDWTQPNPGPGDRVIRFNLQQILGGRELLSYANGLERRLAHRLQTIDVITVAPSGAPELHRRYEFEYEASPDTARSLLSALHEYGSDADSASSTPPRTTRFEYHSNIREGTVGWEESDSWYPEPFWFRRYDQDLQAFVDGGTLIADMNGDGLPDIIHEEIDEATFEHTPESGIYLNNGESFAATSSMRLPSAGTGPTGAPLHYLTANTSGHMIADLNGDGRADYLRASLSYANNLYVTNTYTRSFAFYKNDFDWQAGAHTDDDWTQVAEFSEQWTPAPGEPPRDLYGHHEFVFTYSQFVEGQLDSGGFAGRTQPFDINNDGAIDLVERGNPLAYSYGSRSGGDFGQAEMSRYQSCVNEAPFIPGDLSSIRVWGRALRGVRLLDVNADGLEDWVYSYRSNNDVDQVAVCLHSGHEFLNPETDPIKFPFALYATHVGLFDIQFPESELIDPEYFAEAGTRMVDINGDGRVDIVNGKDPGESGIWLNTGDVSQGSASLWVLAPPEWAFPEGMEVVGTHVAPVLGEVPYDRGVRFADVNGDGMVDMMRAEEGSPRKTYLNRGSVPDRLTLVTNPYGASTSYEYTPSSKHDNPHLGQIMQLATKVTVDDGHGTIGSSTYEYAGGRYDSVRRELQGFASVTEISPVGVVTTTQYHQVFPLTGQVLQREVREEMSQNVLI